MAVKIFSNCFVNKYIHVLSKLNIIYYLGQNLFLNHLTKKWKKCLLQNSNESLKRRSIHRSSRRYPTPPLRFAYSDHQNQPPTRGAFDLPAGARASEANVSGILYWYILNRFTYQPQ